MAKQEKKLTDWYSGDQKPVRLGVYEKQLGPNHRVFQQWNGFYWLGYSMTLSDVNRQPYKSAYQNDPWRGLARRPR